MRRRSAIIVTGTLTTGVSVEHTHAVFFHPVAPMAWLAGLAQRNPAPRIDVDLGDKVPVVLRAAHGRTSYPSDVTQFT